MKKTLKALAGLTAILLSVAVTLNFDGCTKVDSPSLYNQNLGNGPQPVVDSLTPTGSALAGIDTITIYGKNFSAGMDSNQISFMNYSTKAMAYYAHGFLPIISASPTRLMMIAPAISGDTIQVRVSTLSSEYSSSTYNYKLVPAVTPFSTLASGESFYGIAVGYDDSLYVSISNLNLTGTKDEGIFEIGPSSGIRAASPYANPTSGNIGWPDFKFGPGGYIYAAKGQRAVYRLSQGGSGAIWANVTGASFSTLDFDPNHNLWVGGNDKYIYKFSSADLLLASVTNVTRYPFVGNVRSIRYYNGYLYFAASVTGTSSKVYRAPIVSDTLGTPEVYFDLASDPTGGNNIYAITFSEDGDMYAGTDSSDYLIVVHPGGAVERRFSLYAASKALNSSCRSFAWIGSNLYASTAAGELLKIVARKQGAPYCGIQ